MERYRGAACTAALIEHVGDGLSGERAAAVSLGESELELVSAVLVEQVKEATGSAPEVSAVKRDVLKERLGGGASGEETITTAVIACFLFRSTEG